MFVQLLKETWGQTGLTVTSDGFTDTCSTPLLNIIACSPKGEVFLRAVDTSGETKTGEYISSLLIKEIEDIGPEKVIQV
jgi:Protein of unknown function (DUF 659)